MPSSKLAFFRYLLIDRMITNRHRPFPTKDELLEACQDKFGVKSVSTIEKDLNAMRYEFDAPIAFDKRQKGYFYTEPGYKLLSVNLSDSHLVALQFVETFLEQFKGLPIFGEFSDAVDKVLDGLEITRAFNQDVQPVQAFMQIDKSPYIKGSKTLSGLVNLAADKQVVSISYQKFGATESKQYTLHPYLLKEFKHLWYIIGYVEEYDGLRTFGVDRIHSYARSNKPFVPEEKAGFDARGFFRHCYGITALNEQPEEIILSFTPQQGNYVKAVPLHPSQEILEDNTTECRVRLFLINNFELRNLLLGFGASVKVLSPASLRETLKKEYASALEAYAKP